MAEILIIGCGYTGRRIARLERAAGHALRGLVSSEASEQALRRMAVEPLVADLDAEILPRLRAEVVYYCAPPPGSGEDDPRLARALEALRGVRRVLYLSTTGVYGDLRGGVATEATPVTPATARARRRVAAERRLAAWSARGGGEWVILRVAGIYGPGRLPLERLRRGEPYPHAAEAGPGNRIHVDDLARAARLAMWHAPHAAVYNVSDGVPLDSGSFAELVADVAGLPRPPRVSMDEARQRLDASRMSFLREARRVDNRRLLRELGFELRYADPRKGIAASLRAEGGGDED